MNASQQLRVQAEAAKLRGMEVAANTKPDRVAAGKIAMLRALLVSADGTATIDDATIDLTAEFMDGGRWRGSVCRSLAMAGVTERVSVEKSDRPSRHRGYVTRWQLVNRRKAALLLSRLVASMDARLSLAAEPTQNETPPTPFAEEQVDGVSMQSTLPGFNEKESTNG